MASPKIQVVRILQNRFKTLGFVKKFISTSPIVSREVRPETQEGQEELQKQKDRNEEAGSYTELVRDFLDPKEFHEAVRKEGIEFFCGVPDSLLKDYCAYVTSTVPKQNHIITANEGAAIALASGYHLSTGKTGMVYLQNSGLGNIVNPLMSLASTSVYSIPMLLFVGWRGEPGKRDEPQHVTQGKATPGLLDGKTWVDKFSVYQDQYNTLPHRSLGKERTSFEVFFGRKCNFDLSLLRHEIWENKGDAACGIPFQVLPDYIEGAQQALYTARKYMEVSKGPYCLLVKRQTFLPYRLASKDTIYTNLPLNREGAVEAIVGALQERDVVVGTTGMLSRELFELREKNNQGHEKDFLTVGSMGHASSIALGISMQRPRRQIFCLDGDGAAIMHLGNLATVGNHGPPNYKHVVINNGAHDSVGGQPTDAEQHDSFNICKTAMALGYRKAITAETSEEVRESIRAMREMEGPVLLEIKVRKGSRKDLGRPTRSPKQNKADFMHFLAID